MIKEKHLKFIILFIIITITTSSLFSQKSGLMKSIVDSKTGLTFNNFRTDSTETVFYEVKIDNSLVYNAPKNNSDLVYSLDVNSMVEYLEMGPQKNFVKIRIVDTLTNVIEGWIRKTNLSKMKFYGRSFLSFAQETPDKDKIKNDLIDPRWVKEPEQKIFTNANLTGSVTTIADKGDLVYVDSLLDKTAKVRLLDKDGTYISGYIGADVLSPLAIIDCAKTDFENLFKKVDPLVFMYDLDKSGFVSYSGILVTYDIRRNINEDKVCREIGEDSLMYKFTFSENVKDIVKKWEKKSSPKKHDFVMYRQLPDEKIFTRADTINCRVFEIVHTPRSASIALNNIEETEIMNKISKFYIHHIDKFDMDIVFHKETHEYFWSYKKNSKTGEYIENKYKPSQMIKRVIAFRKYDIEE